MKSLEVPITIEADCHAAGNELELVDRIRAAVVAAAGACGYLHGSIGVLITDDETIHGINRDHLDHDYPTDVISFAYKQEPPLVEGELVASVDTAVREATQLGWSAVHELLLYVVHGTLHVCGMDDQSAQERRRMRLAERQVLSSLGITDASDFDPDAALDATSGLNVDPPFDVHHS
ncbi:MAG: rRNA maturation RNase YbeY [Planctomycetaceae bacterium]